jgi:hypothetical protein
VFFYLMSAGLFYLAFLWTLLMVALSPAWLNILCLGVYLLVIALRSQLPATRLWGRIYDTKTRLVFSDAVLELVLPNSTVMVGRARSDEDGRFFLKAAPGKYRLSVYQKIGNLDARIRLGDLTVSVGTSGVLNANIGL